EGAALAAERQTATVQPAERPGRDHGRRRSAAGRGGAHRGVLANGADRVGPVPDQGPEKEIALSVVPCRWKGRPGRAATANQPSSCCLQVRSVILQHLVGTRSHQTAPGRAPRMLNAPRLLAASSLVLATCLPPGFAAQPGQETTRVATA